MKQNKEELPSFPFVPVKTGERDHKYGDGYDNLIQMSHLYACPRCHRVVTSLLHPMIGDGYSSEMFCGECCREVAK